LRHNIKLVCAVIAVLAAVILTGIILYARPRSIEAKAAIIDPLSSTQLKENVSRHQNLTFIREAKNLLMKRFSTVDYYSDNATIEQYRRLPTLGYKFIVWRTHTALDEGGFVAISSSEKYDSRKYAEYAVGQITLCNITHDPNLYFAITPRFIKEIMTGGLKDSVVVLMSCNGLNQYYYGTAEALVEKGAKAIISWTGWIDPSDNDNSISLFLDRLINENSTISEAVDRAPTFTYPYGSSVLQYYPANSQVADYHIPDYRQDNISTDIAFISATAVTGKIRWRISTWLV